MEPVIDRLQFEGAFGMQPVRTGESRLELSGDLLKCKAFFLFVFWVEPEQPSNSGSVACLTRLAPAGSGSATLVF